jgi:hypothetical protein
VENNSVGCVRVFIDRIGYYSRLSESRDWKRIGEKM